MIFANIKRVLIVGLGLLGACDDPEIVRIPSRSPFSIHVYRRSKQLR